MMNENLQQKLELFVSNVNGIKKSFPWQEPMVKRLASLIYALEGQEMNATAVVKQHRTIKDSVSAFSTFRGNLSVLIAAMLSLAKNPRERFADTQEVYRLLKAEKFRTSDYLVAAAYEIASQANRADFPAVIRRMREIFLAMRSNNRFLIGADDYIYAAMLALAGLDADDAAEKVRRMYELLRADFPFLTSRSCLLHLAQIMVLGERKEQCVSNLIHMNRILREHKIRLDKSMVLPSLGVLAAFVNDPHKLAAEITASVNFIRTQKGFGAFSVMSQEINMYAVALISTNHLAATATSTMVTNLLIAQQTAMMVAMITATQVASQSAAAGC